jgi:guanine deaminase
MYFGSNHLQASVILAKICGEYGQRALVGKTCSDQLLPEYYVETTENSLADMERFIVTIHELFGTDRGGDGPLVQPVVTPRFVCLDHSVCNLLVFTNVNCRFQLVQEIF